MRLRSAPVLTGSNGTIARYLRLPGAPGRPGRWPWPPEKRGRRWIDLIEACQLLGACCVGIRRGHQSGRSAPTLNTLSCSVTSTEPACAMALQETAARRFCDCQHVRRPPRLAVMLGLRHGGRELLRGLQGRSRVGSFGQLHHTNLLLKRPSCPGVRPGRWPLTLPLLYIYIKAEKLQKKEKKAEKLHGHEKKAREVPGRKKAEKLRRVRKKAEKLQIFHCL